MCKGCGRGVGGGTPPSAAHRLDWVGMRGQGARVRSVEGEVSTHRWGKGEALLSPGGMLPFFLFGGHFSSKLIHFPGRSAGLFVWIQLTVQASSK